MGGKVIKSLNSSMKGWRVKPFWVALFYTLFLPMVLHSQPQEYTMKAILLSKIINYFEWPESIDKSKPFTIGVVGDNRFGKILDKLFLDKIKKLKSRKVEVVYLDDLQLIDRCDVLFIAPSMRDKVGKILNKLKNSPTLLFGDSEGLGRDGVHINFILQSGKVRFELNEDGINQVGLKFDYRLRKISKPISSGGR